MAARVAARPGLFAWLWPMILAGPALVATSSRPAAAAVYTVNTLADNTLDDGQLTLREALIATNDFGTNDEIHFASNILPGTIVLGGAPLPPIGDDLIIFGPGPDRLTIDGNNLSRVFEVGPVGNGNILGLTITRGRATGLTGGGAVLNGAGSSLLLIDVVLTSNASEADGGAILNQGSALILNTVFRANSALNGGAVFNDGGTLQVVEASFEGNFTGGIAPAAGGGGAIASSGGTAELNRCTLSNNRAGNGGAVVGSGGSLAIRNGTISGNQAINNGGGVAGPVNLTLQSTTIALNRADNNGDGIGHGGGVSVSGGTATIDSTIVANNLVGSGFGTASDIAGTVQASSSYNLVGVDTGLSGMAHGSNGNQIGTAVAPFDGGLVTLADNGGATRTHALLPDSRAVDASSTPACATIDQRMLDRPLDGDNDGIAACDIGAFEAFFPGSQPADFFTIPPCRIADTRVDGPAIDADTTRLLPVAGLCGIPADARAVALNVTGLAAPELGNLRLYPAGSGMPLVSTVNFKVTAARGNNAVVTLGAAGMIAARVSAMSAPAGSLHVVIDAFGYFR